MGNVSSFMGLSGAQPISTTSYAGTPGPGPAPNPWKVNGATIFYDEGGVTMPANVPGGSQGKGTINVNGLFEDGQPLTVEPTGPAGGDLAGTYPDPLIKPSVQLRGNPTLEFNPPTDDDDTSITTTEWTNAAIAAAIAALPPVTVQEGGIAFGGPGGAITSDLSRLSWNPTTFTFAIVGVANIATNTNAASQVLTIGNASTGASATSIFQQYVGAKYVNRQLNYAGNYLHEVGAGIPIRYSDFDIHHFRTIGGIELLTLNATTADFLPALTVGWLGRAKMESLGDGLINVLNNAKTAGVRLDVSVDGTLRVLGRAGSNDAKIRVATPAAATDDETVPTTAWVRANIVGGASVGVAPPATPNNGQLWFYSDSVASGGNLMVRYDDGNSQQWVPAAPPVGSTAIPPGAVMDFAGAVAPVGWLICDGASYTTAAQPGLFAAIGYTYGGSGSNFSVPDCRGRVTAAPDGGAGRLGMATAVGAAGGNQNLQAHAHGPGNLSTAGHGHGGSYGTVDVGNNVANGTSRVVGTGDGVNSGPYGYVTVYVAAAGAIAVNAGATDSQGAGGSQNIQPTIIMNKMIKT